MKKSSALTPICLTASAKRSSSVQQLKLFITMSLLALFVVFCSRLVATGQSQNQIIITNVSTTTTSRGTVVSISGTGPLGRAQTWQDSEGFHVVMPDSVASDPVKAGKGVKVRRIGRSVEIILQTKPGANVNVEEVDNRLNLVVDGKLENRSSYSDGTTTSDGATTAQTYQAPSDLPYQPSFTPRNATGTGLPTAGPNGFVDPVPEQAAAPQAENPEAPVLEEANQITEPEEGLFATLFSGTSVLIVFALGLVGLLVTRKLGSRKASASMEVLPEEDSGFGASLDQFEANGDQNTALVPTGNRAPTNGRRKGVLRMPSTSPASLFGAYRIDQEVGKLIMGQAHRMDVLSSRAPDDRRAIVTSLVKTLASHEHDEISKRRAREALEEYGFVARECAALLMDPDAFERTSAARSLGEIKSPAALPFLLEGLYDNESIVRNQAVISIGELKIPGAIGALLDMARRHPDVPSSLVSRALSACSVEGLDFFDVMPDPGLLSVSHPANLIHDITHLEPASSVEDLPESSDNERCFELVELCKSEDVEERAAAVKDLAEFQVQSSVAALSQAARFDVEPNIRHQAITSLASINHESVFPAILIGMADETREVRAAAARSLSRLSFDRADAYVRVMESPDEQLIADVASACIRAGIVMQNIDRLASNDRRQAYEAFSLICLLAKANMIDPILEAICEHENTEVRILAVHLLATTGRAEVFDHFQQLSVRAGITEDVKTALLEAMYKMEEAKPKDEEQAPDVMWVTNDEHSEVPVDEAATAEQQPQPASYMDENAFDERDI